jgi:hypothetical protein
VRATTFGAGFRHAFGAEVKAELPEQIELGQHVAGEIKIPIS